MLDGMFAFKPRELTPMLIKDGSCFASRPCHEVLTQSNLRVTRIG
jgi:hypothetical protein